MAQAKRSPQNKAPSSSTSSPSALRRKPPRRVHSRLPSLATTQSISSPVASHPRPVLVPLQPNLRRLPSRLVAQKDVESELLMRDSSHVTTVGMKRKRVASTNENSNSHLRAMRVKRLRSNGSGHARHVQSSSTDDSESELSGMEVDAPTSAWPHSDDSANEDQDGDEDSRNSEEEDHCESTDEQLIHNAPSSQLRRLRKGELVRLYQLAALPGDPESLTKSDIVNAILVSRDDLVSVPPSSPPGKSDYSSDEGNVAGDEETDVGLAQGRTPITPLRRRVTADTNHFSESTSRPIANRSLSMGQLGYGEPPRSLKRKASVRLPSNATERSTSRRRTSNRSSPTTSTSATTSNTVTSPPATRLRSRKASTATVVEHNTPVSKGKGKSKAKQVEFSEAIEVHLRTPAPPPRRHSQSQPKDRSKSTSGSELDLLQETRPPQPSPRRLRSKDREAEQQKRRIDSDASSGPSKRSSKVSSASASDEHDAASDKRSLRKAPTQKAKGKMAKVDSDAEEEEHEEEEVEEEEEEDAHEPGETEEEEEVDELISSASLTPPPESTVRSPVRRQRQSRTRTTRKQLPTGEDENEGDDEEEEEDVEEAEEDVEEQTEEQESVADDEEDDDESTIQVEPRRLRNGKIVGEEEDEEEEEEAEMEVDDAEEDEADEGQEAEEEAEDEAAEDEDEAAEEAMEEAEIEEEEDEPMDDGVDLTAATAKTLVRMRRDDLVRLCEQRDLEPVGTKPQLAEALLQWRDRQAHDLSSPSSTCTVRPASNRRRRKGKQSSASTTTTTDVPVLLRSEKVHTDEPRTPVPGKEKESEDLELDLESLGLEDREIPPEKLVKLEKIGSGGFKDVFIGKFKGRRIAISEFRGQLSAMDIKELKLLGAFDHPNIVRFLGVSIPENTKETPVMIVSELCSNGDLFDYIRNVNPPSLHKVLTMMLDIARGLEYLHKMKPSIIHRDCKSSNILITAKGTAKIADFGLAKVKQSTRSMVRSLVGTVNWQAPELWHAHPKYNHKVDVFSCAMVFWEMLQWHVPNKKFPWEGMNEHAIYEIVGAKRQRPAVTGLRKQWCPEIVDLIERMWQHEHQDRPTMSEVVAELEELVRKY